jgi:hypothetical protein
VELIVLKEAGFGNLPSENEKEGREGLAQSTHRVQDIWQGAWS